MGRTRPAGRGTRIIFSIERRLPGSGCANGARGRAEASARASELNNMSVTVVQINCVQCKLTCKRMEASSPRATQGISEGPRFARLPKNPKSSPAPTVASGNVGRQLGAVARRVRESQDLTLTDVATSAGISAGMLSRLETGHVTPSLETLVALAGALGARPARLPRQIGGGEWGGRRVPP